MIGVSWWQWLIISDAGLLTRIGLGTGIFVALAVWDYRRKGPLATRWREYLFLLASVAIAVAYGSLSDQITVTISWEYFYYGKFMLPVLEGHVPPDMAAVRWQAALVGAKATWTGGLVLGVAFLLANNPHRKLPQLTYRGLFRLMTWPLISVILFGTAIGIAGYLGAFSQRFQDIVRNDLWRPRRFMCTWGIHLGEYVGGIVGIIFAVYRIRRNRAAESLIRDKEQSAQDA